MLDLEGVRHAGDIQDISGTNDKSMRLSWYPDIVHVGPSGFMMYRDTPVIHTRYQVPGNLYR